MDAYGDVSAFQYRPSPLYVRHENDPWTHEQALHGIHMDRIDITTLHRFQQDFEHPSYASGWIDDYGMTYPHPSLEAGLPNYYMPEMIPYACPSPERSYSPSNTATSPSQMSSSYGDRYSSPLSPRTPSIPCCSPYLDGDEIIPFGYGGQAVLSDDKHGLSGPCVAMHDVQIYADAQTDKDAFDDDNGGYYAYQIQEGYQPMPMNVEPPEEPQPIYALTEYPEGRHPDTPNIRRRRPQATRAATSHRTSSKVTKRANGTKRSSHHSKPSHDKCNGHNQTNSNRAFPCPLAIYGCASTFGSKNEWKRHINTQHMRLGYWRCDLCDQGERKPNDFNRKDLFIQHVRRMHPNEEKPKASKSKSSTAKSAKNDPEEQALAATATRCWRHIRSSPEESACLFCDVTFNGPGTWDERLEHIGRHMESAKKDSKEEIDPQSWQKDFATEEWLARERIIIDSKDGYTLAGS